MEVGRRQQERPTKAQAVAGSRSVRPRRRRSTAAETASQGAGGQPAAEAASQGAGARRQQKRSLKAQAVAGSRSVRPSRRRPPAAETFAQGAGGRRQVRKSTFRPNRTPRSPVSSLWTGGQRRAGCGICENAFSAPRRFRDSSRKGYMIRFLFPGPA